MARNSIHPEDFLEWAKENKDDYYDLFDDYFVELYLRKDADTYLNWAYVNVEEFEEQFEEEILPILEELEEDDYFGTEGFNRRFA